MEKESIISTVWVMYSFLGKNKLMLVMLYWRYNTTFHWSGHFVCMSCICGQQKCKRWCKIKRSESTKIWHPHGSCRGFQANVEIYRVFIEMKSKFGLYSSWHSNCNLRYTLVLKGHYLHNSSQLSSMNFIASDCNLYFTSWLRRHSQKIFLNHNVPHLDHFQ